MATQFLGTVGQKRNPLAEVLEAARPAAQAYGEHLARTPERDRAEVETFMGFAQQASGTPILQQLEERVKDNPEFMEKLEQYAPGALVEEGNRIKLNVQLPNQGQPVRETGGTLTFLDRYGNETTVVKDEEEITGDPQNYAVEYNPQTNQVIRTNRITGDTTTKDIEDDLVLDYRQVKQDGQWTLVPRTRNGLQYDKATPAKTAEAVQTDLRELEINNMHERETEKMDITREQVESELELQWEQYNELQKQNAFERELARDEFDEMVKENEFLRDLKYDQYLESKRQFDKQFGLETRRVAIDEEQLDIMKESERVSNEVQLRQVEALEEMNAFEQQMTESQFEEEKRRNKALEDLQWADYNELVRWHNEQRDMQREELDLREEAQAQQYNTSLHQLRVEKDRVKNEARRLNLTEQQLRMEASQWQNIEIDRDADGNVIGGRAQYIDDDGEIQSREFDGSSIPLEALPYVAQYQEVMRAEDNVEAQFKGKDTGYVASAVSSAALGDTNNPDVAAKEPSRWRVALNNYAYAYGEANNIDPEQAKAEIAMELYEGGHIPGEVNAGKISYAVSAQDLLGPLSPAYEAFQNMAKTRRGTGEVSSETTSKDRVLNALQGGQTGGTADKSPADLINDLLSIGAPPVQQTTPDGQPITLPLEDLVRSLSGGGQNNGQ